MDLLIENKNNLLKELKLYLSENDENNKNKILHILFKLKKLHKNYFIKQDINNENLDNEILALENNKYKYENLKNNLINIKDFKIKNNNESILNLDELENENNLEKINQIESDISNKLNKDLDNRNLLNDKINLLTKTKEDLINDNNLVNSKINQLKLKTKEAEEYLKLNICSNYILENNINLKEKYLPLLININNEEFKNFIYQLFIIKENNLNFNFSIEETKEEELYLYYILIEKENIKINFYYYLNYNIIIFKIEDEFLHNRFLDISNIFINPVDNKQYNINKNYLFFNFKNFTELKENFLKLFNNLIELSKLFNIIEPLDSINKLQLYKYFNFGSNIYDNKNLNNFINQYFSFEKNKNLDIKILEFDNYILFCFVKFNIYEFNINFKLIKNNKKNKFYKINNKILEKEILINDYSYEEKLNLLNKGKF